MATIKLSNKREEKNPRTQQTGQEAMQNNSITEAFCEQVPIEKEEQSQVKMLGEVKELREECIKHFKMSDGTFQAKIFNDPVHYYDEEQSAMLDIDNTFCPCEATADDEDDDFEGYVNRDSKYKVKFSKNTASKRLFVIKQGNHKLVWKLLGKKNATSKQTFVNTVDAILPKQTSFVKNSTRGEIVYPEFVAGADLQYIVSGKKVKENIIVKERQDSYVYEFELKLTNLEIELSQDQRSINLYVNNVSGENSEITKENIFTIPMPYMYDSLGTTSQDVNYELDQLPNGNYLFSIIADSEWINASNRQFPVIIDPVIHVGERSIEIVKAYNVTDYYPPYEDTLIAGKIQEHPNEYKSKMFFRFNLPSELSVAKITSATMTAKICASSSFCSSSGGFYVKKLINNGVLV